MARYRDFFVEQRRPVSSLTALARASEEEACRRAVALASENTI
jgi:hypothetical protein